MAPIFEHETCGRCGGTGHYSYNQISGTRCFGCNGTKDRLTKRGLAAQDFFNALRTVKRDDVKVGDRVIADCYFSGRYNAEVTSIQSDALNPQHVTLHLRELPRKDGAKLREMNYGALVTCTFQRVLSKQEYADNVAKALEYQATLTKMGKPKKGK